MIQQHEELLILDNIKAARKWFEKLKIMSKTASKIEDQVEEECIQVHTNQPTNQPINF